MGGSFWFQILPWFTLILLSIGENQLALITRNFDLKRDIKIDLR